MKATISIGIQPGTKLLRIARQPMHCVQAWTGGAVPEPSHDEWEPGHWIIWLHTNDFIHGTFLRLYDNGLIENVTIRSDRPDEDIFVVKPPDQ